MKKSTTVIGIQWGDEGKGKITDYLAPQADVVARYQGGANAGHTIYINDKKIVLHQIPSGVLNDKICVIGPAVVFDPENFCNELNELKEAGFSTDKIYVDPLAHVVMPYHKKLDIARENFKSQNGNKIGTTSRGIGPTYEDLYSRVGIRLIDFCNKEKFEERLQNILPEKNAILKMYGNSEIYLADLYDFRNKYYKLIKPFIKDTKEYINFNDNILLESAQGTMLDIIHGTYPFCTSSYTVATSAYSLLGVTIPENREIIGVMKPYVTAVGSMPFPTEDLGEYGNYLREKGKEYGATTGRPRRCGALDIPLLSYAIDINGVTSLALTKMDILNDLESIKVCIGYNNKKDPYSFYSIISANDLFDKNFEPIYEYWAGWQQDISGIDNFNDLPKAMKEFISKLEDHLHIPVKIISTGANREQTFLKLG